MEKELTIKEILDEMSFIKARLIKLAEKYNKLLINVSAISWKDIMTQGGKKGDIMLNKEINKESTKNEFDIVLESYNSYKIEAIEKIKEMIATKSTEECIVYFRDNLKWKWEEISKMFNYSIKQCNRLYKKGKCPMLSDNVR